MKIFFVLGISLCHFYLHGQSVTLSGYMRDSESGENLIGATVYETGSHRGTTSNNYGFYSFTTTGDSATIHYSYVGYQPQTIRLLLKKDSVISIWLKSVNRLNEVVISGNKVDKLQESSRMGTVNLPIGQLQRLPAFMGEIDIIRILQLLPGVQGGSEGNSGLYIRGGGPDQNLILLDGVPVYNPSHLYGFFSTFNADAINHVELVKGGFPARYGGRLSSVVDISMKEGNQNKLHGQGSIGIIASKFVFEGPIKKDQTSFIFSARRSYLNLLKSSIISKQAAGVADDYYFYDINFKINHKINQQNRIYLSTYLGEDKASANSENIFTDDKSQYSSKRTSSLQWGNSILALRWNHIFNDKLFANFAATYSQYRFQNASEISNSSKDIASGAIENQFYNFQYQSGIRDLATHFDFDFVPNTAHYIRFGVKAINHLFTPGALALKSSTEISNSNYASSDVVANELSAYIEDDWQLNSKFKINAGLHSSSFLVEHQSYSSLQPRISARFLMTPEWSIKASYASMRQFIHLLTNAGIGLPTDLWVPATATVKPQGSTQWSLGAARTWKNEYEISIEAYYKQLDNLIEYKDGATYLSTNQNWQDKIETGQGESYGIEWFVHKKLGRLNGWVGYTLSWANRQFNNLNGGRWFPYRYDRRHDAKITIAYNLTKHIDVGLTWVYGSGNAISVPFAYYDGAINFSSSILRDLFGNPITQVDERNGFRLRDYHRLDLNASYQIERKNVSHQFTISVYNAYGRKNPFYVEFGYEENKKVLKQISLFGIMPSLTYSIKF